MTHRAGAWMAAKQVSVVSKAMRKGGGSSIGASFGGGSRSGGGGRGDEHGWRCRWLCAAGHAYEEKSRGAWLELPRSHRPSSVHVNIYPPITGGALGISATATPQPPHIHHTHTHTHRTTRSQGSHHQVRRRWHPPFTKGLASRRHSTRRLCYNSISLGSIGLAMAGAG